MDNALVLSWIHGFMDSARRANVRASPWLEGAEAIGLEDKGAATTLL